MVIICGYALFVISDLKKKLRVRLCKCIRGKSYCLQIQYNNEMILQSFYCYNTRERVSNAIVYLFTTCDSFIY